MAPPGLLLTPTNGVDLAELKEVREFKLGGKGVVTPDGKAGFRVEWDPTHGPHVNAFTRTRKSPHFTLPGNEQTVKTYLSKPYCR